MSIENLRFTQTLLSKPIARGLAAETTLEHFAIVTYRVDPSTLRKHLHPRFEPACIADDGGARQALVSVVTFLDRDFRFVAFPWFKRSFGQTNYRAYVEDTETGEQVAWFFGTCLDSASVVVPRYLWKLPWHRARMGDLGPVHSVLLQPSIDFAIYLPPSKVGVSISAGLKRRVDEEDRS
jgi:uncharacterized protein YqjF (DUF2071 family)